MKKYFKEFVLAILAGLAISIGGTAFLAIENKIVGSLMFTVGLYTIVVNGLFLYTGKIGYLVNEKKEYLLTLLATWLGNLCGTYIGAQLLFFTRMSYISETAATICETKLAQPLYSAFILAIFCGILMYVAVDGYKQTSNPAILFICVSAFILCGFEHCIANMYYFSMGGGWSLKAVGYLLIMTLGNSVGGMLIPLVKKLR